MLAPLALAPLAIGGVHRSTQAVLWCLVAVSALATVLMGGGRRWRLPKPIAALGAVTLALGAIQLAPLPDSVLTALSPTAADWKGFLWAVPAGMADPDPAARHSLALSPQDAALSLAKHAAYLLWFMVLLRVFRGARSARPLWVVALLGAGSFMIALGHELVGAHRILGVYELRELAPYPFMATFVNANFQASLYAVAGLVALGLAASDSTRGVSQTIAVAAAATSLAGVALTLSRGGMLMIPPAIALWFLLSRERGAPILRAGLVALLVTAGAVAAALYLDATGLGRELASSLAAASGEQRGKWELWGPSRGVIELFWQAGTGPGGFRFVFDQVAPELTRRFAYTAPESWPLQLMANWGLPAALLIAGLAAWALVSPVQSIYVGSVRAGAAAGVGYLLLHDVLDYSWTAPGVAMPIIALVAYLWARPSGDLDGRRRPRGLLIHPAWVGLLALATLAGGVGVWSVRDQAIGDDRRRLREAAAVEDGEEAFTSLFAEVRRRRPADFHLYWLMAERLRRTPEFRKHAAQGVFFLNRALFLRPSHAASHHLAGEFLRWAGRRWQSNLEYRLAVRHAADAAQERRFVERRIRGGATVDDLLAIAGDDLGVLGRMLDRLLTLRGPAAAHALLTKGAFLERAGDDELAKRQAANVLLAAGRTDELRRLVAQMRERHDSSSEAWYWAALVDRRDGDLDEALSNIRRARELARGPDQFHRMIEVECKILRAQGDITGITKLLTQSSGRPEVFPDIYAHRAALQRRLGKNAAAAADWRRAIQLRPNWLGPRLGLAETLTAMGRRREARKLYQDVLRDHPADKAARRGLDALAAADKPKPPAEQGGN